MSRGQRPDARQPRSSGSAGASGAKGEARGGQGAKSGKGDSSGQGDKARLGGQGGKARQGGQGGQGGKAGARRADADDPVARLTGPLEKVLTRLPETQRKVLELRMGLVDGHPHDIADTARALGLSLSEARDIEKRAFEHIREAIPLQQLQRFLER